MSVSQDDLGSSSVASSSSSSARAMLGSHQRGQYAIDCVNQKQDTNEFIFEGDHANPGQAVIDDLYNGIFQQRIIRDAKLGVQSKLIELNGQALYLRDATKVSAAPLSQDVIQAVERENAKMMALNYLLAYQRIAIEFGLDSSVFINDERSKVLTELSDPENDPIKLLKNWVNDPVLCQLTEQLEEKNIGYSRKGIRQLFNRVNQAAALEHATAKTATVHRVGEKNIVQIEAPVSPISTAYIDEIRNRRDKIWYQSLSKTDQLVVDMYQDKLLDKHFIIPSQLRDLVPGTRNLFRYQVFSQQGDEPVKSLVDCNHTGTAVTLVRPQNGISVIDANEEQLRLTKLNMSLQRLGAGQDYDASHMAALNSDKADLFIQPKAYLGELRQYQQRRIGGMSKEKAKKNIKDHGDDRPIVKMTTEAPEGVEGLLASNFVFNGFRLVSSDHLTGTEYTLNNSKKLLQMIRNGSREGKIKDENTPDDFYKRFEELLIATINLEKMVQLRNSPKMYRLHGYFKGDFTDKEFKAKDILTYSAMVTSLSNQLVRDLEKSKLLVPGKAGNPEKINFCFGCASGENRTGAGLFHLTHAILQQEFPEISEQESAGIIANGYHIQDAIGGQGGVLGGAGARYKSKGSWTKSLDNFTDIFFQHIADIKKSIPRSDHYKTSRDLAIYDKIKSCQQDLFSHTRPRHASAGIEKFNVKIDEKKTVLYLTSTEKNELDLMQSIHQEWKATGAYNEDKVDLLFPGFLDTLSGASMSEDELSYDGGTSGFYP